MYSGKTINLLHVKSVKILQVFVNVNYFPIHFCNRIATGYPQSNREFCELFSLFPILCITPVISSFAVTVFCSIFLVSFQTSLAISSNPFGLRLLSWYLFSRFLSFSKIHSLSFHNSSNFDYMLLIMVVEMIIKFCRFCFKCISWNTLLLSLKFSMSSFNALVSVVH